MNFVKHGIWITLGLLISLAGYATDRDPRVTKTLSQLHSARGGGGGVGGAGNGGGQLAMEIARVINQLGIQKFGVSAQHAGRKYHLIVGEYDFCRDDPSPACIRSFRYYARERALLVDQHQWELLPQTEKENTIDEWATLVFKKKG